MTIPGCKQDDKALGGLQIYDLKEDPENPRLLSHWETGVENGMGVHRFAYNGGRYVYLSSECPGFVGFIVRILDISDPTQPKKLGQIKMQPPFAGKFCGARCHTYLPLKNRDFAVLTNEGERFAFFDADKIKNGKHKGAQPMNNLHMIDVSDPYYIKEIAYFIPPNPAEKYFEVEMPGPFLATTEDVVVDDRGYIYIDTFHDGMYILKLLKQV